MGANLGSLGGCSRCGWDPRSDRLQQGWCRKYLGSQVESGAAGLAHGAAWNGQRWDGLGLLQQKLAAFPTGNREAPTWPHSSLLPGLWCGSLLCYRAGAWVAFCSFITLAAFGGRIVFKQKQRQDVRSRADSGDGLMHIPFPNSWLSTQKPWGVSKKPTGFLLICSAPLGQTLAATSPPPFQRWGWDCAGKMLSALKEAFRSC